MIQTKDTKVTKDNPYVHKLHGMKKYNNKKYTKSRVILKRHMKASTPSLVYNAHQPKYNYLKYWRIVRKWAHVKYKISTSDLEIILFLYDEGIWKKSDFFNATAIHSWDRYRFKRFKEEGLIRVWREGKGYKGYAKLYELSPKAKRICKSVYLKLEQEELIPENKQNNPMYLAKNKGYVMDYYKKAIALMNAKKIKSRNETDYYDNQ